MPPAPKSSRGKKTEQKRKNNERKNEKKEDNEDGGRADPESNGDGLFEFNNGAVYEGAWKVINGEKMRHGFGVFANSGEVYRGEWKENKIHGTGEYKFANGNTYTGNLTRNLFDGIGTYRWADGSSYVGQWYQNKMHGTGTYTTRNGDRFHGTFVRDQFLNKEGYWIPPAELGDHLGEVLAESEETATAEETVVYRGACPCRGVRVHLTTPVIKSYFCHCSVCRRQTGGPFTLYAMVEESQVKFTGTGGLRSYSASEDVLRYHCKTCGGPVAHQILANNRYRIPLARFTWSGNQIDRRVAPTHHEHYQDRVMDMPDSLVKFKSTKEAGETMGDSELSDKKRVLKTKSADKKRGEQLRGACLCGVVTINTMSAPLGDSGHTCHCLKCQSYSGAPCVSYGVFPDNAVSFSGSEFLRSYQTTAGAMRYRCRNCTALCRLHLPGRRLSQVPLALLVPAPASSFHQYYSNRLLDYMDDGIKYEREKGGSALVVPIANTAQ